MNFARVGFKTTSKELAEILVMCDVVDVDLVEIAAEHPRVEVEAGFATPCRQFD